jgi:hypothetical protein
MGKTKISIFKSVNSTYPKKQDLDEWLLKTMKPPSDLKKRIIKYRKTGDKKIKEKLPCVTISATFKNKRNLDNIKSKNGFIVLDIDRHAKNKKKPSNTCIDMALVKSFFSKHPSTYYCGYSCGGDGVYVVIKISKKKPLIDYFNYFEEVLRLHSIAIDESCKDYTRLRFFSYDNDAYYCPEATEFKIPKKKKIKKKKQAFKGEFIKDDYDKVEKVLQLIEANAIDITSSYSDWVKIAGALYNSFGEKGRDFFHRVSVYNHGYHKKKCDNKFDKCMNMSKISLSSFFYIADSYGIRY